MSRQIDPTRMYKLVEYCQRTDGTWAAYVPGERLDARGEKMQSLVEVVFAGPPEGGRKVYQWEPKTC